MEDFKELVYEEVIPFMKQYDLVEATIKTSDGNRATVKRDKHGFYKVKVITQEDLMA